MFCVLEISVIFGRKFDSLMGKKRSCPQRWLWPQVMARFRKIPMFVLHLTLREASLNMWHIFRVTCSAMQSCRWTWNDTFPTASHAPASNRVFVDTIFWVNGQWENRWWPLWCCYCAFPSARQAGLGAKRCVGGAQNRHNTVLGPDHHSQATRCFQFPKNTPFWIVEIRSKNHFLSLISLINCLIVHFICSFIVSINWETPCFLWCSYYLTCLDVWTFHSHISRKPMALSFSPYPGCKVWNCNIHFLGVTNFLLHVMYHCPHFQRVNSIFYQAHHCLLLSIPSKNWMACSTHSGSVSSSVFYRTFVW